MHIDVHRTENIRPISTLSHSLEIHFTYHRFQLEHVEQVHALLNFLGELFRTECSFLSVSVLGELKYLFLQTLIRHFQEFNILLIN